MKNVICNAFAFREDYKTSMQMGGRADEKLLDIYMKNIFVSLQSASLHNPEDEVMLLCNAEPPLAYQKLFAEHGIRVQVIAFDHFVMPKRFDWALAFFKLCALQYLAEKEEYDRILLLDADTITMHPYTELWEEADYGLLLYGVGHAFHHHDRELIRNDYRALYPEGKENIVHYGGELVCGRATDIRTFVKNCTEVYNTMQNHDFALSERTGDETILSIAAARMEKVIDAAPYLFRFWTEEFYLISTVTVANPVAIWHIPNEKKTGFISMFEAFTRNGAFPSPEKAAKIFGIVRAKRPRNGYTLAGKIRRKLQR